MNTRNVNPNIHCCGSYWGVEKYEVRSEGNPTPLQYFVSTGLGGDSPFGRDRGDTFGVGWYYIGATSEFGPVPRALFGPRNSTGVELVYNVRVTPRLNITPDIQYIKPGLGAIADEVFVFGWRVNVML
jgi:porin